MPRAVPAKSHKACDACRTRKLKCSNRDSSRHDLPKCDNCARSAISCVSSPRSGRRRPRAGKIVDALRSENTNCREANSVKDHDSRDRLSTNIQASIQPPKPLLDARSSQQLHYRSPEHTGKVFDFFMTHIYATLPIIHFDNFTTRLQQDHGSWDVDFRILGHALHLLQKSFNYALTPPHGHTKCMSSLVSAIEQLRCTYDFAEEATADTVTVSFVLFVACHVLGRHKRAFLYLSEASKLVGLARKYDRVEAMRLQRLKSLLFITASASTLLSGNTAWKVDAPSLTELEDLASWYGMGGESTEHTANANMQELDRFAIRQLQLMTRMHLKMAEEGPSSDFLAEDVADTVSNVAFPATPTVRIVTADLSITQLWFSSTSRPCNKSEDITKLCHKIDQAEITARKALAWARSLSQSELRLVGLGKMVDIIKDLVDLCAHHPNSTAEVEILARDLMDAICAADYELTHSTTLARCTANLKVTP